MPKMKDFTFSDYLRLLGFTYYEFSSNLARLRLSFPLIIARIEKHTIVKILIFLQITVEKLEKISRERERDRERDRERQRERQRETERDRETDRETDRERDRETERQRERQRDRQRQTETFLSFYVSIDILIN